MENITDASYCMRTKAAHAVPYSKPDNTLFMNARNSQGTDPSLDEEGMLTWEGY